MSSLAVHSTRACQCSKWAIIRRNLLGISLTSFCLYLHSLMETWATELKLQYLFSRNNWNKSPTLSHWSRSNGQWIVEMQSLFYSTYIKSAKKHWIGLGSAQAQHQLDWGWVQFIALDNHMLLDLWEVRNQSQISERVGTSGTNTCELLLLWALCSSELWGDLIPN